MKAWMVYDEECHIYCRAETRGKARQCWPGDRDVIFGWDMSLLRVVRAPWLDGPGPMDYVPTVWVSCPHYEEEHEFYEGEGADEREARNEIYPGCTYDCIEGEILDKEATLKALGEQS